MNVDNFGFKQGYSIIHFVLIYMMARLVSLYKNEILQVKQFVWWVGYLLCTVILAGMYGVGIRWDYANPINVISSFCLFFPFLHYTFHNKYINWIAKNTFAVYIIQVTNPAFNYLIDIDNSLLDKLPYGIYLVTSLLFLLSFFAACIVYDKVRELLMSPIEKWLEYKLSNDYKRNQFA